MGEPARKIDIDLESHKVSSGKKSFNHSLFTMYSNKSEIMLPYIGSSLEEAETVKINWSNIFNLMRDGAYYTPRALAVRLDSEEKIVRQLLKENIDKLYSPKARSLKNGQCYFVLKDKRDKSFEFVLPVQNRLKKIFG